ncbi:MAG: methyltransferase domain-containing protein [Deltaproteobacteria bacterium]|nr:MAG: methyltransferase domain-containing protein [Deltaproteobacteria bacterium]
MTGDPWNPDQYARFRRERAQPFYDLLARVLPSPNMRVVDLGCGSGALTRELHERLGAAATVGVDASREMLAGSDRYAGDGVSFVCADLASYRDGAPYDLVFSNAALHWLPDHASLFANLASRVASGGQLAVQIPCNDTYPSHTVLAEVARETPFADALGGYVRESPVLPPWAYADLLHRFGFAEVDVWLRVYTHELPGPEAVVEWVKGSTLTDYRRRLAPDVFDAFVARYRQRLMDALPDARPFVFPFQRLFVWGRRG